MLDGNSGNGRESLTKGERAVVDDRALRKEKTASRFSVDGRRGFRAALRRPVGAA
jgi:hypothetical protein